MADLWHGLPLALGFGEDMNRIWSVVVAILAAGFASSASADFADKLSKLVGYVIVDSLSLIHI